MEKLIERAYKNAEKYGVYIDLLENDDNVMLTVHANSCQLVVYPNGGCSLWDYEGFRIKDYQKMAYGFKALSKVDPPY